MVNMKNDTNTKIAEAVKYIKSLDVNSLNPGKYVVDDDFYFMVQEYTTKSESECRMESHRKYIDIQYIIGGSEVMKICDISRLEPVSEYNPNKDIIFWQQNCDAVSVELTAGSTVVLYPNHGHMGCVMTDKSELVRKVNEIEKGRSVLRPLFLHLKTPSYTGGSKFQAMDRKIRPPVIK